MSGPALTCSDMFKHVEMCLHPTNQSRSQLCLRHRAFNMPAILSVQYGLNTSGSKWITLGLDSKTLQPGIRIASEKTCVHLTPSELEKLTTKYQDDINQHFANKKPVDDETRPLSEHHKVNLRLFQNVPVIVIQGNDPDLFIGEVSWRGLNNMEFLIETTLVRLHRCSNMAPQWIRDFANQVIRQSSQESQTSAEHEEVQRYLVSENLQKNWRKLLCFGYENDPLQLQFLTELCTMKDDAIFSELMMLTNRMYKPYMP